MKTKIMYMELKSHGGSHDDKGEARIGRIKFSKSQKSLHYQGKTFRRVRVRGGCGNYCDVDTGDEYWISGVKKNGEDRYYWAKSAPVKIDEDVRGEYWTDIRNQPERTREKVT